MRSEECWVPAAAVSKLRKYVARLVRGGWVMERSVSYKKARLASLDEQIAGVQNLVLMAWDEVQAGNSRMSGYLEGYANRRDTLIQERESLRIELAGITP